MARQTDRSSISLETHLTLKRLDMVLADDRSEILDYFRQIESREILPTEEAFIEFQLELQEAFKDNRAMIFGYANGYSGYIPDAESYEADSYETNPTIMHRAGQLAGKEMLEEGKALLANVGGIGASFE